MVGNILQFLQGFPPQPTPIQNGYGNFAPQSVQNGYEDEEVDRILGNPKTISGRIQEWLGAREPNQAGMAQGILSGRFEPTTADASLAAGQTLFGGGKPVSSQGVADERMKNSIDSLAALSRAEYMSKGGGSGSVFAQTMEAINADPVLTNLPMMEKIRLAQNKVGTNQTYDPATGRSMAMAGAPEALGALSYGEEIGTQNARVNTARPLAVQKGMGEADTAEQIAINTAVGKEVGGAMGANAKKAVNAPNVMALIQQAKGILPTATGGGLNSKLAAGKSFFNYSDMATQSDAQLDAISAGLLNNVPRMEGPQSDADRFSYEKAAGDIGNRSKPVQDRLAALDIIGSLQQKYLNDPYGGNNVAILPGANGQANYTNDTGLPTDAPRQAPDGNFYIPDPNRPGKYLMVSP